jgi:hypothetical protein
MDCRLAELPFQETFATILGSEPSTGFMILAGSGMLGMVIRLRQRNIS